MTIQTTPHAVRGRMWLLLLLALAVAIHGLFLAGDLAHPERFEMGDRSYVRMEKIQALLAVPPGAFWQTLAGQGPPGDYALHAGLMALGGPVLVILVQVALQLSLVAGAFLLVQRVSGRPKLAFGAGLLTLVLPGGLMSPHMLTTETLSAWCLCVGAGLICWAPTETGAARQRRLLILAFVLMGLAAFVRPQALLTPVALWLLLPWLGYERRTLTLGVLAAILIFPVSGILLNGLVTGAFGLGRNEADLGVNFMLRVDRMAAVGHFAAPAGERLSLGDFLVALAQHPVAALRLYIADAVNLMANPGANHVFGRYLQLFATEDVAHWHNLLDSQGPAAVAVAIVREGGLFLFLFILASLVHLAMLAGFAASMVLALRRGAPLWLRVVLIVALTILIGSFAAGLLRWAHRAPAEPLLACAAAYGLAWIFSAVRGWTRRGRDAAKTSGA